ncbi:hypothetical protein DDR56_03400 [Halomonas venusta]|uniref:Uncharacterized protein n=1 Tax=Vreelandella venusta TaxID=44935 RepID=A0ABX2B697_9GAMM|nr:hypothetical protein [Halomonas venusta]
MNYLLTAFALTTLGTLAAIALLSGGKYQDEKRAACAAKCSKNHKAAKNEQINAQKNKQREV